MLLVQEKLPQKQFRNMDLAIKLTNIIVIGWKNNRIKLILKNALSIVITLLKYLS